MVRPKRPMVISPPRPGRWAAILASSIVIVALGYSVATNPRFEWGVVGDYLLAPDILRGLAMTLELTLCAMAIGVAGGLVLALMRLSKSRFLSSMSLAYIWFFRGTPVLVQLLFWFNIQALYPKIALGLGNFSFVIDANAVITPLMAAIFGLGLNEAAYMAEIARAGITSIDDGQVKAAQAVGMSKAQTFRRIVLPQAMRVIIPPTANEAIGLLKTSSIASVIAVTELLYSAQLIYSVNYLTIPLLIVASIWYLAVTTILTAGQHYLERRFSRGSFPDAHRV